MNANYDSQDSELPISVVALFERMPLPQAPTVSETLALLEPSRLRGASDRPRANNKVPSWFRAWRPVAAVLAIVAVLSLIIVTSRPLSAMERVAEQLRSVQSYSYHLLSQTTQDGNAGHSTTWREEGRAAWQAPDAFRERVRITKSETPQPGDMPRQELVEDFQQLFPAGRPGIFIDHKRKTYFAAPFDPIGSRTYPLEMLKLIRDGRGTILRQLGTKEIAGKRARGYVVPLTTGSPARSHDVEVWVDPETDLPLEFGYQVTDRSGDKTTLRVSEFKWNVPTDSTQFEPTAPAGYMQREPPRN